MLLLVNNENMHSQLFLYKFRHSWSKVTVGIKQQAHMSVGIVCTVDVMALMKEMLL